MSQTFNDDNIYLNGGTLLGGAGVKVVAACLYTDSSSNKYIYVVNDDNGMSGYKFSNHTLYGISDHSSAGIWLDYDTDKITSFDCAPIQYKSYLIIACNNGKIASFDGSAWKYPDASGDGAGPYGSSAVVGGKRISSLASLNDVHLVVGAEEGRIASWNGSAWTNYDASSGLCSNGGMLGRRDVSLMACLDSTRLIIYEDSGRAYL